MIRLRHLEYWIETWQLDEMLAGVKGRGAEDGWYSTALLIEDRVLAGEHVTIGATDVYKCFDQLQRKLIYRIAEIGGMPARILDT